MATYRHELVNLIQDKFVGIELGVAEGFFSHSILSNNYDRIEYWFSVDMWSGDRGHDVEQYKYAFRRLWPFHHKNSLLKMKFDEALTLFEDETFDIIYVDGYAHTGQENGKTLTDWWPKLKSGGMFSGDDYDDSWPLTKKAVDDFAAAQGLEVNIFDYTKKDDRWCSFPSWYIIKP